MPHWIWAVVAFAALMWLSGVQEQMATRRAARRAERKAAKVAKRQKRDEPLRAKPDPPPLPEQPPAPDPQPAPERRAGPAAHHSDELRVCQTLAARQAATITSLRKELARSAASMGMQGTEIGRLMALVRQQEGQIRTLQQGNAGPAAHPEQVPEAAAARIAELDAEVADLKGRWSRAETSASKHWGEIGRLRMVVQQQEAKIRALQEGAAAPSASTDRGHFRQLKALIVKELHPDHAPADSVDRALRTEVFKLLWPKIEAITDRT